MGTRAKIRRLHLREGVPIKEIERGKGIKLAVRHNRVRASSRVQVYAASVATMADTAICSRLQGGSCIRPLEPRPTLLSNAEAVTCTVQSTARPCLTISGRPSGPESL